MSEVARLRDRMGLVTLAYAHRAGFALVASLGLASVATRVSSSWGGDAALFEPGGVLLVETQRLAGRAIPQVLTTSLALLVIATLTGALVLGALIDAFSRRQKIDAGDLADGATRAIGTVSLLLGAGLLAQGLVAALVIGAGVKLIGALHLGFKAELWTTVGMVALAALLTAAVGAVRDLACAAAVLDRKRFGAATSAAWRSLRWSVAWSYGWRAALALGVAAAGWTLGSRAVPALVHQVAIFAIVAIHCSWVRAVVERTLAEGGEPPVRHGLPSSESLSYVAPPSPPAAPGEAGFGPLS